MGQEKRFLGQNIGLSLIFLGSLSFLACGVDLEARRDALGGDAVDEVEDLDEGADEDLSHESDGGDVEEGSSEDDANDAGEDGDSGGDSLEGDTSDDGEDAALPEDLEGAMALLSGSEDGAHLALELPVEDYLVTLVKPDVEGEKGAFFALHKDSRQPLYVAPHEGASGFPENLQEGDLVSFDIKELSNLSGTVSVTQLENFMIRERSWDLDGYYVDATAWTEEDWEGSQASYIDLYGKVSEKKTDLLSTLWAEFGFSTPDGGMPLPSDKIRLRLPLMTATYYGLEGGCSFDFIAGGVLTRQDGAPSELTYLATFFAPWSFYGGFQCEAPVVLSAISTGSGNFSLEFSRPMEESTLMVEAFAFTPALEILELSLEPDLKTVKLLTAPGTEGSYLLELGSTINDTNGASLPEESRSVTIQVGAEP